jgi:hypothetical protein
MDRRDSFRRWWREDTRRMLIIVEEGLDDGADIVLPAKFEVCETCGGHGTHVNPSIDAHGISADEFAEDPDFAEDYFAGRYDVPCVECNGRNVALVVDRDAAEKTCPAHLEAWDERIDSEAVYAAEVAAERRMGA